MRHAVFDCPLRILFDGRTVHWLKKEMLEVEILELLGHRMSLRKYKLQLASGSLYERSACLGAHAHPVDRRWSFACPIGLDGNREAFMMECVHQLVIQLEKRLASGADDKPRFIIVASPCASDRIGQ
jgi:hypothetical protein